MQEILDAGRYRCREQRLCLKTALNLIVNLVRRCDVLRIHLGHHELSEHLNLLHLRQCDFVAHLNRLQITYRRLVLQLKVLQGGLFGLEVLRLSLCGSERAVERVQRGLDRRLRTLDPCGRGSVKTRIELLELLGQRPERYTRVPPVR